MHRDQQYWKMFDFSIEKPGGPANLIKIWPKKCHKLRKIRKNPFQFRREAPQPITIPTNKQKITDFELVARNSLQ